jgi:hypothetical protein
LKCRRISSGNAAKNEIALVQMNDTKNGLSGTIRFNISKTTTDPAKQHDAATAAVRRANLIVAEE